MGERVSGSPYRLWLLMRVSRTFLTTVILLSTFAILVASSQLGLSPIRLVAVEQNSLQALFSSLMLAIITGTTIVVTIGQLVLSQELGAAGDQQERMQQSLSFRKDVENVVEGVSHPEPPIFLADHLEGIERYATLLRQTAQTETDDDLRDEIETYVDSLVENAQSVRGPMSDATFGDFQFIWQALNFNYSWKIYRAREIRHGYELSGKTSDAFDELIEALMLYGPAREHFKTLYFQWALINLSRAVLYISIPALVALSVLLLFVDSTTVQGTTLGIDNLVWIASAGVTVGFSPFVVFTVYILRIVTVAKRTLAMGPFILRDTEREDDE